jgi:hypothetical protein
VKEYTRRRRRRKRRRVKIKVYKYIQCLEVGNTHTSNTFRESVLVDGREGRREGGWRDKEFFNKHISLLAEEISQDVDVDVYYYCRCNQNRAAPSDGRTNGRKLNQSSI